MSYFWLILINTYMQKLMSVALEIDYLVLYLN